VSHKIQVVEPSTPYPGSTSAPGNTGTLYSGNTTAPGNPGNIASTSTLHLGNTSSNVVYIDASLQYPEGVLMGNPGSFLTTNLPYGGGGGCPLQVTWGFLLTPCQPTQT
jgi:hypothetical protein